MSNNSCISESIFSPKLVLPIEFNSNHPGIIAQKGAFLCAESGIKTEVTLTKKFGAGLFGGEGFVLQDISGNGMAFLEVDGDVMEKELQAGETMLVGISAFEARSKANAFFVSAITHTMRYGQSACKA